MIKKLIKSMKNPKQWTAILVISSIILIGGGISLIKDNANDFGYVLVVLGILVTIFGILFIILRWKDIVKF